MRQSMYVETADQVLAKVRAKGQKISRAQLTRWHVFGVVPRPIQRPRKGVRGTDTVYPYGTTEQVLAAASFMKERRTFDDLRVELWLMGFDISREWIAYRLRDAAWPPLRVSDAMRKAFPKIAREVEAELGGDDAEVALKQSSDDELFALCELEPGLALSEAVRQIPLGYVVEWYHKIAFVARWFLATQLPDPQQRMAIAWIFIDLMKGAKPIPGLAPKRPRGRPRKTKP